MQFVENVLVALGGALLAGIGLVGFLYGLNMMFNASNHLP